MLFEQSHWCALVQHILQATDAYVIAIGIVNIHFEITNVHHGGAYSNCQNIDNEKV